MSIVTSTLVAPATSAGDDPGRDGLHIAAGHLYDAECAFHDASQTHVDAWILAASDRLHSAADAYLAAVAASSAPTG